jgi:hypothetical protein
VIPTSISGPNRIRKLKRKKTGKMISVAQICGSLRELSRSVSPVTCSTQLVEPPGTSRRMNQVTVSSASTKKMSRNQNRQNEARRRLTTSSSLSSASSVP